MGYQLGKRTSYKRSKKKNINPTDTDMYKMDALWFANNHSWTMYMYNDTLLYTVLHKRSNMTIAYVHIHLFWGKNILPFYLFVSISIKDID